MKKIINGKRYDTGTAIERGTAEHNPVSSFDWYQETLYQKKTGEFFIYGEGHARSRYAMQHSDGMWGPGRNITPLSFEEAKEWTEENLSADEYEAIFGEVAEDDSRQVIALSLSAKTVETLKRKAAETGKTQSQIVEDLILGI